MNTIYWSIKIPFGKQLPGQRWKVILTFLCRTSKNVFSISSAQISTNAWLTKPGKNKTWYRTTFSELILRIVAILLVYCQTHLRPSLWQLKMTNLFPKLVSSESVSFKGEKLCFKGVFVEIQWLQRRQVNCQPEFFIYSPPWIIELARHG